MNDQATRDILDFIIVSFTGIYGAKFSAYLEKGEDSQGNNFNLEAFRHEWGLALQGLTAEQVKHAIDIYRRRPGEWPPTPGALVRVALGVPSTIAIMQGKATTLAAKVRTACGGTFALNQMNLYQQTKVIESVYDEVVDREISDYLFDQAKSNKHAIGHNPNIKRIDHQAA